jgi:predicted transcriptional regulator
MRAKEKIYTFHNICCNMAKVITELEKTILLSALILSKGDTKKLFKEDDIVLKFPMRQRKTVRRFIKKLVKGGYLIEPSEKNYRLSDEGLRIASRLLYEGGTFV